ncbi:MAG: (Acyl-carrier-protein) S-malonyltransferase [Bacteroidota bacterium]|nr:(Acyl-carrier-protein) S-malonyltransferase [Bacteroidota bacterium]
MKAYIFPGQGSQFKGMGKDLFESSGLAKNMFLKADEILGFSLSQIMFEGSDEELKQTKVTQPAVFLHSVISAALIPNFKPGMVAGHSLGEFSALVANQTMGFEDGLKLIYIRALAMQKACEIVPSCMAAVLGYESEAQVENICKEIKDEVVVPANYNAPGQLVISGSVKGIEIATEKLKAAGVKRVIKLPVGGAFHSPLMEPARKELEQAIRQTAFNKPLCPIYQNVTAKAESDSESIKQNLIAQLTAPVLWTQSVKQMLVDGTTEFIEVGPGNVLQGLVKKIIG